MGDVGFSYMWLSTFIHIIYIMVIVYLNVELFIDVCDGELLMWNLTRGIYTRRGNLCWNTIEELIEIDSTGIFIMYVHV